MLKSVRLTKAVFGVEVIRFVHQQIGSERDSGHHKWYTRPDEHGQSVDDR